jgi:hypothetical protein
VLIIQALVVEELPHSPVKLWVPQQLIFPLPKSPIGEDPFESRYRWANEIWIRMLEGLAATFDGAIFENVP